MQDAVEREGNVAAHHALDCLELFLVHARAGDAIRQLRLGRLYADLHVIETGGDEPLEQRVVEKRSLRDQVGVQPAGGGRFDDAERRIGHERRLPARYVDLQNAQVRGFTDDALPRRDVELVAVGAEVQGIITVRTLQVAAIR